MSFQEIRHVKTIETFRLSYNGLTYYLSEISSEETGDLTYQLTDEQENIITDERYDEIIENWRNPEEDIELDIPVEEDDEDEMIVEDDEEKELRMIADREDNRVEFIWNMDDKVWVKETRKPGRIVGKHRDKDLHPCYDVEYLGINPKKEMFKQHELEERK